MKYKLILMVSCIAFLFSQLNLNNKKLDKYLDTLEKYNKAMLSLAISYDDKIIYRKAIGFLSIKENKKSSPKTKYRIGSITKTMTALLIFQLIEKGKLSLDTKLEKFYPKIVNANKITISDLLYHRSGIQNFTNKTDYLTYNTKKKSKLELMGILERMEADFEPNTSIRYSNSAFLLLGFIIEDLSKKDYGKVIYENIAKPLNLKDTYFGGKIDAKNNEASSYKFATNKWKLEPETDMSIPFAAGAIVSTPVDLLQFINALFTGQLVSKKSLAEMTTIKDGFGRGLIQFPFNERKALGHNGGIDGFVSNLAHFQNENISVAITSNGINSNFNDILIGVLSIIFNKPYEIPDFSKKIVSLTEKELSKYTGIFTSKQLPLKITISTKSGQLFGQATGQNAFPLTTFSKRQFKFSQAGLEILFSGKEENVKFSEFTLKQGGGNFLFTRD